MVLLLKSFTTRMTFSINHIMQTPWECSLSWLPILAYKIQDFIDTRFEGYIYTYVTLLSWHGLNSTSSFFFLLFKEPIYIHANRVTENIIYVACS